MKIEIGKIIGVLIDMKKIAILLVFFVLLLTACNEKEILPSESAPAESSVPSPDVTQPAPPPSGKPPSTGVTKPAPPSPGATKPAPPSPDVTEPAPSAIFPLTDLEFWAQIDGSTATIPMSFALYGHFAENSRRSASEVIYHNKTHEAYKNLLNEKTDIIFVTEPSAEAQKLFGDAGVEIDVIPIVKDAFVLFVNAKNPVSSLTQDQLRDIYSGKITNWKDVGGDDLEIIPFQRGSTSGSQTLFLSLLMRDTEPMLAPSEYYYADMGGIVDAVAEYENGEAAIGFSVFYYASYMYGNDDIRFLKVDGVLPTEESIIVGDYPLESYYYAALRKDTPIDHPARELVSWILGDEGQALMRQTGYVPLRALAAPYNKDGGAPQYYGSGPDDRLEGIGAELYDPLRPINIYGIPKKLDTGIYYSHPFTSSEKVNGLLDSFIGDLLSREDFKELMAENIHKYGVPFRQHTLEWGDFLTCVVYFGDISPYDSFYLYSEVEDTVKTYATVCIDTGKGAIIDPKAIIDELLKLEYMEGAKTVYERADRWSSSNPDHIPSEEYIITALWINSEQAVVIEITDQGNSYRYGICTNDFGGFAGP